jgi:hypothetical protein
LLFHSFVSTENNTLQDGTIQTLKFSFYSIGKCRLKFYCSSFGLVL